MSFFDAGDWEGKLYSGGWVAGGGAFPAVKEVATGHILGNIALASPDDLESSIALASDAQVAWTREPARSRAAVLRRAGALLEEQARVISGWVMRESGAPRAQAAFEVSVAADALGAAASSIQSIHSGSGTVSGDAFQLTRRVPVGIVGITTPETYPLATTAKSIAGALATGNAAIVVVDARVAVCGGLLVAAVLEAAGLASGVLSVLPGRDDMARLLAAHPQVRGLSFTGTASNARDVVATAAAHFSRTVVTVPQTSALVVLPGADVAVAVASGTGAALTRTRRIARGCGIHLVHESLVDLYVDQLTLAADELVVGDPLVADVTIGPLLDTGERDRLHAAVTAAVTGGARLASGGRYEGLFYRPTVLVDSTGAVLDSAALLGGPVAVVVSWTSLDDALELLHRAAPVGYLDIVGADSATALEIAERSGAETVTVVAGSAGLAGGAGLAGATIDSNFETTADDENVAASTFWTEQRISLPLGATLSSAATLTDEL
jgi:benzaldehyde dehydrogenase (NAD)